MSINERFETIIQVLFAGNKRAFANAVSISPTVVENIVGRRKGKPSYNVLKKVCANANISAEWLLFGTGEMAMDMFNIRKDLTLYAVPDEEDKEEKQAITTVFTKGGESQHMKKSVAADERLVAQGVTPELTMELLNRLAAQAEEIGRLRELINQMRQRFEKDAANANTDTTANVG